MEVESISIAASLRKLKKHQLLDLTGCYSFFVSFLSLQIWIRISSRKVTLPSYMEYMMRLNKIDYIYTPMMTHMKIFDPENTSVYMILDIWIGYLNKICRRAMECVWRIYICTEYFAKWDVSDREHIPFPSVRYKRSTVECCDYSQYSIVQWLSIMQSYSEQLSRCSDSWVPWDTTIGEWRITEKEEEEKELEDWRKS